MASLYTLVACVLLPYFLWSLQTLLSNYQKARQSGYQLLICPVNPNNVFWMVFSIALRPHLARYLPKSIFRRLQLAIYGWEFLERYEVYADLGSSFILVTPGKNEFYTADPEMAQAILTRRDDFVQSEIATVIMGMLGPNIATADGNDWKRQRKIVAPLLNERISQSVWMESSKQAAEMMQAFTTQSEPTGQVSNETSNPGETNATIPGVRSIAINVLGAVMYGSPRSWREEKTKPPPGYQLSYMDSLLAIVQNLVPAAVVPAKILTSPVMPQSIQRIGHAMTEFPGHVDQLLEVERKTNQPDKRDLMSTLIRASDAQHDDVESKTKLFLSEKELAGNLFQFSVAGFDTTANTMAYAITLLTANPEWQEWIREEIDQEVLPDTDLKYETTYPKMKRCLALMFETMRLYNPVAHITRQTKTPQHIESTTGQTYQVPPNATIYISSSCMHVAPSIWGPDALEFRPSRWLNDDGTFFQPPKSSFLPWSGGPRNCPGQKMAEVEFVAVMMTIFRDYKVEPVVDKGDTLETARGHLKALMADSQPIVTLQMNRPKDVKLKWERR